MANLTDVINPSIAFIAGIGSFFSPCSLPIVPAYLMYMAGTSNEEDVKKRRNRMIQRTVFFVLGFTLVFVSLGYSASAIGRFIIVNKIVLEKLSGAIMIMFGLNLMGFIKLSILAKSVNFKPRFKLDNSLGAFIMGVVFAAGWTPCFGPELAAILMLAANSSSVGSGAFLLLMYSLGMAIPYLIAAAFVEGFNSFLDNYMKYAKVVVKVAGAVIAITGILVFTNNLTKVAALFQ